MTFCDMLAHVSMMRCFQSLVTATGVADKCLYNYQVRSAPDAGRPLQKSQNGVDADQNHADTQS